MSWRRVARALYWRVAPRPWETPDPAVAGQRFRLAVCAVFKDEAEYLGEWLEFHRAVGVERFFLYDNNSTDDYEAVLAPHADVISLHKIRRWPPQMPAYTACLDAYRHNADWLAFIDIDEFVYSTEQQSLADALEEYRQHPAVSVHWIMFNTSGHIARPEGSQLVNFTRCQVEGNKHPRLIVQPERTRRFINMHFAEYDTGLAVNENHEPVDERLLAGTPAPTVARLRVNHYWTRSVEEWFTRKLARGTADGVELYRDVSGLLMAERIYGTGEDFAIQRVRTFDARSGTTRP